MIAGWAGHEHRKSAGMSSGHRLAVVRAGERSAREAAAHSRAALDRPLDGRAGELWVAVLRDDARLAGAFQRASPPALRRGSGGPEVRVAPAMVHVVLALASPGALTAGDEKRIVNRSVRPLLRALTKVGALAHYFGRDWVSVQHRPVAWVGFAHDATTRRTSFEAFVAVRAPFAEPRPSFLGKAPASLVELDARHADPQRLVDAIVQAYPAAWDAEPIAVDAPGTPAELAGVAGDVGAEPPWAATVEEAIGTLGAGPDAGGAFRVGGDLLVSRDALARLEARVAAAAPDDVARIVDEILTAPGVALDGVRSLTSVRDVILSARSGAPRPSLP
jgi:hypothetical protein